MLGGGLGGYAPGQWSDDTEMACAIARVAAPGRLTSEDALDAVADGFVGWFGDGPADIGNQTRAVLSGATAGPGSAARLRATAADLHARTGRTAGNGSLMRTGPVVLPYLDDPAGLVDAARAVSAITHHDPQAGDACVLWRAGSFASGVEAAIRGGGDTDTVAAIAGALLGARFGASGIPSDWRERIHGWPGLRDADLVRLAGLASGQETAST